MICTRDGCGHHIDAHYGLGAACTVRRGPWPETPADDAIPEQVCPCLGFLPNTRQRIDAALIDAAEKGVGVRDRGVCIGGVGGKRGGVTAHDALR